MTSKKLEAHFTVNKLLSFKATDLYILKTKIRKKRFQLIEK